MLLVPFAMGLRFNVGWPCDSDMDCQLHTRCDPDTKKCADVKGGVGHRCITAYRNCYSGLECRGQYCREPENPLKDKGDSCQRTSECKVPFECRNSKCTKVAENGDECERSSDCYKGHYCKKNECRKLKTRNEKCKKSHECVPGLHCKNKKCVWQGPPEPAGPGKSCGGEQKCVPGYTCQSGKCKKGIIILFPGKEGVLCANDQGCDASKGLICKSGRCRKGERDYENGCTHDNQCKKNEYCRNAKCYPYPNVM